MFMRISTLFFPVVALAAFVAASPAPESVAARQDICSNGTLQCCSQTLTADQASVNLLQGLLGAVINPIIGPLFAINCSPITAIGVGGGATCAQQAVCCTGTQFNGLVNVGCNAVNLGL
ncbi:hypothetical protein ID866_1771 [Astraeus odoratus]|nr:hypothetical protein ID866_1771 [Astraeus odoratus]